MASNTLFSFSYLCNGKRHKAHLANSGQLCLGCHKNISSVMAFYKLGGNSICCQIAKHYAGEESDYYELSDFLEAKKFKKQNFKTYISLLMLRLYLNKNVAGYKVNKTKFFDKKLIQKLNKYINETKLFTTNTNFFDISIYDYERFLGYVLDKELQSSKITIEVRNEIIHNDFSNLVGSEVNTKILYATVTYPLAGTLELTKTFRIVYTYKNNENSGKPQLVQFLINDAKSKEINRKFTIFIALKNGSIFVSPILATLLCLHYLRMDYQENNKKRFLQKVLNKLSKKYPRNEKAVLERLNNIENNLKGFTNWAKAYFDTNPINLYEFIDKDIQRLDIILGLAENRFVNSNVEFMPKQLKELIDSGEIKEAAADTDFYVNTKQEKIYQLDTNFTAKLFSPRDSFFKVAFKFIRGPFFINTYFKNRIVFYKKIFFLYKMICYYFGGKPALKKLKEVIQKSTKKIANEYKTIREYEQEAADDFNKLDIYK